MNSRLLLALAVLLVCAALVAGYMGYRTTTEAREAAVAAERRAANAGQGTEGKTAVIVLRQSVPAFKPLTAEDIAVDYLKFPPPNTYRTPEELIGQVIQADMPVGTVLDVSHFNPGGKVARLLKPGERAVAIPVNEVVGGGGFVQPGDLVDILLYLAGEEGRRDSAQVIMRSVRVLSFGVNLIDPLPETEAGKDKDDKKNASRAERQAKTAVLAIAQTDVTRLLLASTMGELRLAIVPTDEMRQVASGVVPSPADGASQSLPEVDVPPVASRPSAVPAQRYFLTDSALQPGQVAAAPGKPRPTISRPRQDAPPPVIIIRGLSTEGSR